MNRKAVGRLASILFAVGVVACAPGDGANTQEGTAGVGVGAAETSCPQEVTADASQCRWVVDSTTRETFLVCTSGTQTFRVNAAQVDDSAGVGVGSLSRARAGRAVR